MYIINYKNSNDYNSCYGVVISNFIQNDNFSYDITDDERFYRYVKLIPNKNFEGKIDSEYKIRDYIRYYYVNVLSKLDPEKIYRELYYDRLITFDNGEFSHGYIVAAWFELFLGVDVSCVNKVEVNKKLADVKPKWTVDILEDEIKKTIDNMRGFNSVRALYLFNQGEELEKRADELESRILNDKSLTREQIYKLSDTANSYRQSACFRRCDADMAEDEWRERRYNLIEKSKNRQRKK